MYSKNPDKSIQLLNGLWKWVSPEKNLTLAEIKSPDKIKNWKKQYLPTFWFDRDYDGATWYCREFILKKNLTGNNVALCLDYTDDETDIYLNGKLVAHHSGIPVAGCYDITTLIKKNKKNTLILKVEDSGGSGRILGDIYLKNFTKPQEIILKNPAHEKADNQPDWVYRGIIYELYLRSHSKEGNFQALMTDLYRLKQLGVKCIWLMPIFPIGKVNRKGSLGCPYSIADYQNVNPEYGSLLDFYALVKEAHRLGIKIILDIACNHTAWDNWILEKHGDWYAQDWDNHIVPPPGTDWTDVAQLNFHNEDLRGFMTSVMEYWIKEMDIDGYRCDVAEMIPGDFWQAAIKRLRDINPKIFMLAEGSHPELITNGFQMTYAWNTRNSLNKILNQGVTAKRFNETILREQKQYPAGTLFLRFTENHDMPRTMHIFGAEKGKLASVLTYCLPGIPMVYNGQEIGADTTPDLFEKEHLDWDAGDMTLWKFYQALFIVRRRYTSLLTGDFLPVANNKETKVISYARREKDNTALVIGNTGSSTLKVQIDTTELISNASATWERVFGDVQISREKGKLVISLPAFMYCIIIAEIPPKMRTM